LRFAVGVATGLAATVLPFATATAAATHTGDSAQPHITFSGSVHGKMSRSARGLRCGHTPTGDALVSIDGKVGSGEYQVSIYLRGPQRVGRFPVDPNPQNASAVVVQKIGTSSSPTATTYDPMSGFVNLTRPTAGSLDAQLSAGSINDPQPLRVRGTWACRTRTS